MQKWFVSHQDCDHNNCTWALRIQRTTYVTVINPLEANISSVSQELSAFMEHEDS
jgi:hypothetical protein